MQLTWNKTTTPDFSGFKFYVEEGCTFEVDDYAEAYDLDPADLDPQEAKGACDAAARLMPGEWLEVSHEDE